MRALLKKNFAVYCLLREVTMRVRITMRRWSSVSVKTWVVSRQNYISRDLVVGDFGFIGRDCTIYPNVKIGRFVLIAPEVAILGADHEFRKVGVPTCFSGRQPLPETIIGDDVWIGMSSKIMVGTKIGHGAIVAAASVVTKDVPDFAIVAGVPAKVISYRFENDQERARHLAEISKINEYGHLVGDM